MTSTDIYAKLQPIIKNYLPEDVSENEITLESDLSQELNISSAYFIDIILDIEDAFEIQFENDEIESFQTVKEVIEAIQKKM